MSSDKPVVSPVDAARPLDGGVGGAAGSDSAMNEQALHAVMCVVEPLLRMLIAKGATYQMLDEAVKAALVRVGISMHPEGDGATGSQLSLLTGLNRKEIKRLRDIADRESTAAPPSIAAIVYARWRGSKPWVDAHGKPRVLSRGAADAELPHSFDDLVRSITVDHRPRAVLDELLRLKMVSVNEHEVAIITDAFLRNQSFADAIKPLSANLSDHAKAAVGNVLSTSSSSKMLERSIHARFYSEASVAALLAATTKHWQSMHEHLMHLGKALEVADAAAGEATNQRMRIGIYVMHEEMDAAQLATRQTKSNAAGEDQAAKSNIKVGTKRQRTSALSKKK